MARPKRFELLTPRFVVWSCYKSSSLETEPFLLSNRLVVGGVCLPRATKNVSEETLGTAGNGLIWHKYRGPIRRFKILPGAGVACSKVCTAGILSALSSCGWRRVRVGRRWRERRLRRVGTQCGQENVSCVRG